MKKKIAFATCVQLGLSCIEEIYNIGGELDLLITLPDHKAENKSGRIYLDEFSQRNDVPLLKVDNINDQITIDTLKEKGIDWLFIIGWSQIAKPEVLHTPKEGCIGMHPTLLPEGRGRAAIPWTIIKGLDRTGVTMFKLDEGVDTGDIIGQKTIDLPSDITATDLYEKVNDTHIELISDYWTSIVDGSIEPMAQDDSKATKWPGRKPEDGEIHNGMTMLEADRLVRAVTSPYPGAFFMDGQKVYRVWDASTNRESGDIPLQDGYLIMNQYEIEG